MEAYWTCSECDKSCQHLANLFQHWRARHFLTYPGQKPVSCEACHLLVLDGPAHNEQMHSGQQQRSAKRIRTEEERTSSDSPVEEQEEEEEEEKVEDGDILLDFDAVAAKHNMEPEWRKLLVAYFAKYVSQCKACGDAPCQHFPIE